MNELDVQSHSSYWLFYVRVAFAVSLIAMAVGIIFLPTSIVVQGYFALNSLFMVSTTITLVKTLRDEYESQRLIHKISEAKTNRILKEFSE